MARAKKYENRNIGKASEAEIAWLAGILEGEAAFGWIAWRKQRTRAPYIRIVMSDRDVIARVAHLFGGKAIILRPGSFNGKPGKLLFLVQIAGQNAIEIFDFIEPWMGERRKSKIMELRK